MRQIILASTSPRRKELLEEMGLDFTIVPSDFEEYLDASRPVEDIAMELGAGKARAVAEKYPEAIVIGSDTIVTIGEVQLGKAVDLEDARRLVKDKTNQILLGIFWFGFALGLLTVGGVLHVLFVAEALTAFSFGVIMVHTVHALTNQKG